MSDIDEAIMRKLTYLRKRHPDEKAVRNGYNKSCCEYAASVIEGFGTSGMHYAEREAWRMYAAENGIVL